MSTLRRFWAWLRRRPTGAERPEPTDICEVCGEFLAAADVWEIRSHPDDDDMLLGPGGMGGGTYMSATYCAEHFPVGASRWRAS